MVKNLNMKFNKFNISKCERRGKKMIFWDKKKYI